MKKSLKLLISLGFTLSLGLAWFTTAPEEAAIGEVVAYEATTEAVFANAGTEASPQATLDLPEPTIDQTATSVPTMTPTPTEMPTQTPPAPIVSYSILGKVYMGGGLPVAMSIRTVDGKEISSNWAGAIGYQDGDDKDTVFSPYAGTVYSHIDNGFLATWIHSGRLKKADLFAWGLEKFVYMNELGGPLTFPEGQDMMSQLLGARVTLCQATDGSVEPFDDFDHNQPCPGNQLQFNITAAALIERENVDAYEAATGKVIDWLLENDQGSGFDQLASGQTLLLQTCVGKYSDQVSDGTKDYLYNRLILGLSVIEEP